jgi:hypothetical protein
MANTEKPYPKNAPGSFYVTNGECVACGAPEAEAPDLMSFDKDDIHCYFKKQPSTPEELDRALKAVIVSCCDAVHYGGDDPAVIERMGRLGIDMMEEAQKRKKSWIESLFDIICMRGR